VLTSSTGIPIPPCAISLSSSSSYSSSRPYSSSAPAAAAPLDSSGISDSEIPEYPPDVSVLSFSGDAELGEDSDCRRELDGRTGVVSKAEPEPGAWTAEEVRPAVCL
jgi:hypothetical protein